MTTSNPTIALAGCPNSGKSSLFNALTGSKQKVGNYPGVTVEKKLGYLETADGTTVQVIDLPGIYSLKDQSPDETIAVDILLNRKSHLPKPDLVVAVCDATNLERTLGLAVELKQTNHLGALVVNMIDLAQKRGLKLDLTQLEKEFGVPVVRTIATQRSGIERVVATIHKQLQTSSHPPPRQAHNAQPPTIKSLEARANEVQRILKASVLEATQADIWTARIDRLALHPVLGGPILAVILMVIFQAVFSWAATPMELIEELAGYLAELARTHLPQGFLASLIADGVIGGVGSVVVFLPQILILFFFIFLLEGSGYMMRAAFIMDRLMASVGLQGKSFVPLLSSFACAIPGIMSTRTIKNERNRLVTMLIAPLMTCSARLPVYVLLIGAFIPNTTVWGPLTAQGLTMFGLFGVGVLSAMLVAWVSHKMNPQKNYNPLIFDLPSYKWPSLRNIAWSLWQRASLFLRKAGKFILLISVTMWLLATYPKPPADFQGPPIHYSAAGRIGLMLEPVVAPLGFDWRIATGLIPGFAAREVMVGVLGTLFSVEGADESAQGMSSLQEKVAQTWPLPTGLALLVWYIFSPQCLATFAVLRRESNSRKWTFIGFAYMLGLAYILSFLTYQLTMFLM